MTSITYRTEIDTNGETTLYQTNLAPIQNLETCGLKIHLELKQNFLAVTNTTAALSAMWKGNNITAHLSDYGHGANTWFYPSDLTRAINEIFGEPVVKFEKENGRVIVTCLNEDLKTLTLGHYFMIAIGLKSDLDFTEQRQHIGNPIIQNGFSDFEFVNNFTSRSGYFFSQHLLDNMVCTQKDPLYGSKIKLENFAFKIIPHGTNVPFAYRGKIKLEVRIVEEAKIFPALNI